MTKPETDAEFLRRMWSTESPLGQVKAGDVVRLLRLAERGAKVPDNPYSAEIMADFERIAWANQWPKIANALGVLRDHMRVLHSLKQCGETIRADRAMITTALKDTDK